MPPSYQNKTCEPVHLPEGTCQFDTVLYPTEKKFPGVLYTVFVNVQNKLK